MRRERVGTALVVAASTLLLIACGDGGDDQDAFCEAASDTESFEAIFADFDPEDVESSLEAYREARQTEIALRREAPDAIRADIDRLVQFLDDLVEGLEGVDPDTTTRPAIYDEIRTQFDQIEAASQRIETYVRTNCGSTRES